MTDVSKSRANVSSHMAYKVCDGVLMELIDFYFYAFLEIISATFEQVDGFFFEITRNFQFRFFLNGVIDYLCFWMILSTNFLLPYHRNPTKKIPFNFDVYREN